MHLKDNGSLYFTTKVCLNHFEVNLILELYFLTILKNVLNVIFFLLAKHHLHGYHYCALMQCLWNLVFIVFDFPPNFLLLSLLATALSFRFAASQLYELGN